MKRYRKKSYAISYTGQKAGTTVCGMDHFRAYGNHLDVLRAAAPIIAEIHKLERIGITNYREMTK